MKRNKIKRPSLNNDVQGEIYCPYCQLSKMVVYKTTSGKVSVRCSNCGRFYLADYDRMIAEKSGSIRSDVLKMAEMEK